MFFGRLFKLQPDGAIFGGAARYGFPGDVDGQAGNWMYPPEVNFEFAEGFWTAPPARSHQRRPQRRPADQLRAPPAGPLAAPCSADRAGALWLRNRGSATACNLDLACRAGRKQARQIGFNRKVGACSSQEASFEPESSRFFN